MVAVILILFGILCRFIPGAPNFTPVGAIALFSGTYLNRKASFCVPLLIMVISDIFLGLHRLVFFTWGSFILINLLGGYLKRHKKIRTIILASFVASLIFYLLTNFGVWLEGWYGFSFKGLITSYLLALPFWRNFFVSTLFYSAILFGVFELFAFYIKRRNYAEIFLTI